MKNNSSNAEAVDITKPSDHLDPFAKQQAVILSARSLKKEYRYYKIIFKHEYEQKETVLSIRVPYIWSKIDLNEFVLHYKYDYNKYENFWSNEPNHIKDWTIQEITMDEWYHSEQPQYISKFLWIQTIKDYKGGNVKV